ncbi:hypothetical protein ACQEVF_47855 [Nonomuraea polychroma]|uniref:hypothetical protein n=1 Tax=Nonomuraea polychroma TaxID=46176 RepID=UPI003D94D8EE
MATVIVFAMAALCALELVLGLVLLGWAIVELGAFLRRHPDGAAGGLRRLATGARRVWPMLPGLPKPRRRSPVGASCEAGQAGGFFGPAWHRPEAPMQQQSHVSVGLLQAYLAAEPVGQSQAGPAWRGGSGLEGEARGGQSTSMARPLAMCCKPAAHLSGLTLAAPSASSIRCTWPLPRDRGAHARSERPRRYGAGRKAAVPGTENLHSPR